MSSPSVVFRVIVLPADAPAYEKEVAKGEDGGGAELHALVGGYLTVLLPEHRRDQSFLLYVREDAAQVQGTKANALLRASGVYALGGAVLTACDDEGDAVSLPDNVTASSFATEFFG